MIKNYFRILKKPHAYLQTILKTPVKFQKDRTETVGGVKGTKYPLKTRNHAPRATRHAPRTTPHGKPKTVSLHFSSKRRGTIKHQAKNIFQNIGIKHGFSCINICQVPREMLKTEAAGRSFQHLPRDLANVNALKNHVQSLLLHKTENICYISHYFLHYFVSPFHRCLVNAISTDYAHSRARQYTSRNSSKSVAPVRSYWKLRSRALTACELPC